MKFYIEQYKLRTFHCGHAVKDYPTLFFGNSSMPLYKSRPKFSVERIKLAPFLEAQLLTIAAEVGYHD
jgi:hypothetical protein